MYSPSSSRSSAVLLREFCSHRTGPDRPVNAQNISNYLSLHLERISKLCLMVYSYLVAVKSGPCFSDYEFSPKHCLYSCSFVLLWLSCQHALHSLAHLHQIYPLLPLCPVPSPVTLQSNQRTLPLSDMYKHTHKYICISGKRTAAAVNFN